MIRRFNVYKQRYILKHILLSLLIITILLINFIVYTRSLYTILSDEMDMYLTEITAQAITSIQNEINGSIRELEAIAQISRLNNMDKDTILENLRHINSSEYYNGIGISDKNGIAYLTNGLYIDISDREYYKKSLEGETSVSDKLIGKIEDEEIIVYSTPIFEGNQVKYILFAYRSTDRYNDALSIYTFGGKGYSYITDSYGNVILQSYHDDSDSNIDNIFENIKDSEDVESKDIQVMKFNLKNDISGEIGYKYKNIESTLTYASIDINDWYINLIVPNYVILARGNNFIFLTVMFFILLIFIFALLLTYITINNNRNKKRLSYTAFIDDVTKIGNYNYFIKESKVFIEKNKQNNTYFIYLDIDKFKFINDKYGYEYGNEVLKAIANVIKCVFKNNSVYCRLCNDGFLIISDYNGNVDNIKKVAETLSEKISVIKLSDDENLDIKPSLGIYIMSEKEEDIAICLDKAAIAKSQIKGNRMSNYAFYDEKLKNKLIEDKEIEREMKNSLKNKEFDVYLQPKFKFESDAIIGSEALIRWNHWQKGLISPMKFIPLFERNKFIKELDLFVFKEACALINRWTKESISLYPISVNISRVSLEDENIINLFVEIAKEYNVDYKYIQIEITESTVFENEKKFIYIIDNLRDTGFKVSIDDFGSGYSSLNMLKNINVDEIKLDKEFLTELMEDSKSNIIIVSIISMAHQLGMKIVAEGVETQEQKEYLKSVGCDIGQGYIYSKPITILEYENIIKQ